MSTPCDEEYYEFDVITKETRVVHIKARCAGYVVVLELMNERRK